MYICISLRERVERNVWPGWKYRLSAALAVCALSACHTSSTIRESTSPVRSLHPSPSCPGTHVFVFMIECSRLSPRSSTVYLRPMGIDNHAAAGTQGQMSPLPATANPAHSLPNIVSQCIPPYSREPPRHFVSVSVCLPMLPSSLSI
jgi:hypothetical protein